MSDYECSKCGAISTYSVSMVYGRYQHDANLPHEPTRRCEGQVFWNDPNAVPRVAHTRATLYARLADVIRRSSVADAEQLVRLLELDRQEVGDVLSGANMWLAHVIEREWGGSSSAANARDLSKRVTRAIRGDEIGPPK